MKTENFYLCCGYSEFGVYNSVGVIITVLKSVAENV
jgi:hypothetical protein